MNSSFCVEKSIMSLDDACNWRQKLLNGNKKLVVTNGCFDLLHRGHAEYLMESRKLGDALLVLLNSDDSVKALKGENRPLLCENDRAYLLASLRAVDAVVIFNGARCNSELARLRPDIYVKGGDYTLATMDSSERQALLNSNSIICFKPFVGDFSTSNLIKKIQEWK